MKNISLSLNGNWYIDYISDKPYTEETAPAFDIPALSPKLNYDLAIVPVPAYWEDLDEEFRRTPIFTKLSYNPLYTKQKYPQTGYCPDMALPNPYGAFVYKKKFALTKEFIELSDFALYVGGVQNCLSAWINGNYIGRHEGYSCEFTLKVDKAFLLEGENEITLAVSNNRLEGYMKRPVSGLTSRAANECTGGIWGDVELRAYPDSLYDAWVSTSKDTSAFTVKCIGGEKVEKKVEIYDKKKLVKTVIIPKGETEITIPSDGFKKWTPNTPNLYGLKITTENQTLSIRFGIRRLTTGESKLYLNGEPYYFCGTCEHCYHPITVHPTRDKAYYIKVVKTLKSLGFNSVRFHTYIPMREYMEAADELGLLLEVETPNNTSYEEWIDIVNSCRHYPSVCGYSSGNEMVVDDDYIAHLRKCAEYVHTESDSFFAPMSAMRGVEYMFSKEDLLECLEKPFLHHPRRLAELKEFCDLYNFGAGISATTSASYRSEQYSPEDSDAKNTVYNGMPLLVHETCIHGTYLDIGLIERYKGTRIGDTEFMSSVIKHLDDKGLLEKAPLYYKNSVRWQMLLRKHAFESVRLTKSVSGYDFLGDIDTHWHTFGYCVGLMNEFYEIKQGETAENVRRYNNEAVLLCELPNLLSFSCGDKISLPLLISNYGKKIDKATLTLRVKCADKVIQRRTLRMSDIVNGEITKLCQVEFTMPYTEKPEKVTLFASLNGGDLDIDNLWDIYVFPKTKPLSSRALKAANTSVIGDTDIKDLCERLDRGENVCLFGVRPFSSAETSFQLSCAGRTHGHLATAIAEHPITSSLAHEGFCDWQFRHMMKETRCAVLDRTTLPHEPIIDIATSYKNAHREAFLFEYTVGNGKLIVCTFNLKESDPAAIYLKNRIISYAASEEFAPKQHLSMRELRVLCNDKSLKEAENENQGFNKNDTTMKVR